MKLDGESFSALIKLLIFCAATGMATVFLALTLSNGGFGARDEYKAVFTDVTGVAKGDDVRIAGVSVGSINSVEIVQKDKALVTFGVEPDVKLTQNTDGHAALPQPRRSAVHVPGPRARGCHHRAAAGKHHPARAHRRTRST